MQALLDAAKKKGIDLSIASSKKFKKSLSYGKSFFEKQEEELTTHLTLTFYGEGSQAQLSTSRSDEKHLHGLLEKGMQILKQSPKDPYAVLVKSNIQEKQSIRLIDPSFEDLKTKILACNDSLLSCKGNVHIERIGLSWGHTLYQFCSTQGADAQYARESASLYCGAIAGAGEGMQSGYAYQSASHWRDLNPSVGYESAEEALSKLNPQKVATGSYPVILREDVASQLLGLFLGAIQGPTIVRKTSFLKDKMGEKIFPQAVNVIDDPLLKGGLASRPWDGEGVPSSTLSVVKEGILCSWLLNCRSALELGLSSTGHAAFGNPHLISASNFFIPPSQRSVEDLSQDIESGFYVTQIMGHGLNPITGDWSVGASGFWIEKGQRTHAVSEATIAGNLLSLFPTMELASDLRYDRTVASPSLRFESMIVGGQ